MIRVVHPRSGSWYFYPSRIQRSKRHRIPNPDQQHRLRHLPPLRFHCVGGCWDRTQDFVATLALAVRRSNHSEGSHPLRKSYQHALFCLASEHTEWTVFLIFCECSYKVKNTLGFWLLNPWSKISKRRLSLICSRWTGLELYLSSLIANTETGTYLSSRLVFLLSV